MALTISRRDYGDITVLELDGSMSSPYVLSFRETVDDLIRSDRNKIVLLYQGVPYMDSMGLSVVGGAYAKLRNAGGKLVFAGLTAKVREVFELTRLIGVFTVFNTLDEALSSLGYKPDSSNGTE
jgi:anti-sigma B factor antagonist